MPLLEEGELADRIKVAQSERSGVYLGKALSCGFHALVESEEYRRMAAVEDEMWFYRALHSHLEREIEAGLQKKQAVLPAPTVQNLVGIPLRLKSRKRVFARFSTRGAVQVD